VQRYLCKLCNVKFSSATTSPCKWQKKRHLNHVIYALYASGTTQRRIALLLGIDLKTVARTLVFLAKMARLRLRAYLESLVPLDTPLEVQFDEMESSEHSKCLPVSIPLIVEKGTRKILAYGVCSMPAKGSLAKISLKKYGPRADDRAEAARLTLEGIQILSHRLAVIESDQNPKYPGWIRAVYPDVLHITYPGKRGSLSGGQGELRSGGFDPLFSFNHTAAMLRANLSRLFRRTWNTTKRRDRLEDHIALYADFHNSRLTA